MFLCVIPRTSAARDAKICVSPICDPSRLPGTVGRGLKKIVVEEWLEHGSYVRSVGKTLLEHT